MKFISLARVSSKKQEFGHSVAAQHESNQEFAKKSGGQVVEKYDLTISGAKMKFHSGILAKIIKRAKELEATILVWEMDRLTRSVSATMSLYEAAVEGEVEVIISSTGQTLSQMEDILVFLESWRAKQERLKNAKRVENVRSRMNKNGTFGSSVDAKAALSRSLEVRRAKFEQYAQDIGLHEILKEIIITKINPSLQDIADALEIKKVTTSTDKLYTFSTVRDVIKKLGYKNLKDFTAVTLEENALRAAEELKKQQVELAKKEELVQSARNRHVHRFSEAIEKGTFLNDDGQVTLDWEEE